MKPLIKYYLCLIIQLSMVVSYAQKTEKIILKPENFNAYNVSLKSETYKNKAALVVEQKGTEIQKGYIFAGLKDMDFHNGIIEITLAGQPRPGAIEGARTSDVNIWVSFGITLGFLALCVSVIAYIFKTGWRLRA